MLHCGVEDEPCSCDSCSRRIMPRCRRCRRTGHSHFSLRSSDARILETRRSWPSSIGLTERNRESLRHSAAMVTRRSVRNSGPPASGPVTWIPLYYTVYEVPNKVLKGAPGPAHGGRLRRWLTRYSCRWGFGLRAGKGALKTMLSSQARKLATKQVGKAVAERVAERELTPWLLKGALTGVQAQATRKLGWWTSMGDHRSCPSVLLRKQHGPGILQEAHRSSPQTSVM